MLLESQVKTPVLIPEKVSIDFEGLMVTVKGPKGELKRLMHSIF